ncbi:MAG: 2-C-methyl-D-erythritol 2,4-cyclodiphosphate synthase [Clostridia bacterium]|nr:2-C-methyl-D-erythritol 2,4-cyclodiphosphate synthase [Clostridia bacterium]
MCQLRIGHGYDVHRLTESRKLVIGGVEIPYEKGLLGHSDADVLIHAVMDAIIGALALGDIGKHFPDSDERYKGISSMHLLSLVHEIMIKEGAELVNLDATVVIEKPKLAPYIADMRRNIAFAIGADLSRVNIKATTEEHLGFTGSGEGAAAHAVALLELNK